MIVDFQKALEEKAFRPRCDISVDTYKAGAMEYYLIGGGGAKIANDMSLPWLTEHKDIKADEIVLKKPDLEYFRYLMLSITERLAKEEIGQLEDASKGSQKISAYLRPVFTEVTQNGHNYWEALTHIRHTTFPVPKDYFVMLPEPDASGLTRDDVIRKLVPFKNAQREALAAGWRDEVTAIRITRGDISRTGLVLN